MKKVITLAALLVASASAFADDAILQANNQISLAVGAQHLNYHEPSTTNTIPGDLDSEHGSQFTAGLTAVRQGSVFGINDVYTRASAFITAGNTSYTGYLLSTWTPKTDTTRNIAGDFQLRVGKALRFGSSSQFQVVPYVQYAYHVWSRTIGTDASEVYSHHTLGGGILGQYAPTSKLVLSADVGVSAMLGSQMQKDNYPTFKTQNRPVTEIGLGADYAVTRHLHASVNYRLTKFHYGRSADVAGPRGGDWYEPSSRTTEQVITVGLGYSF
jgi:opacity protein-like surface antigen